MQENKTDVIDVQELDHKSMIAEFIEAYLSHAFNFVGVDLCCTISNKLRSRIYNDSISYQINYTSSEIILSSFKTLQSEDLSEFLEVEEET